jgi:hypothetical protein
MPPERNFHRSCAVLTGMGRCEYRGATAALAIALLMPMLMLFPAADAHATTATTPTPIATVSEESPIAGGDGWLVWSVPVTGGWGLEGFHEGTVQVIATSPRPQPFDVSVGNDGDGHAVAVFSRCVQTPEMLPTDEGNPGDGGIRVEPSTGTGCRIHELVLPDGPETALPIPHGSQSSDTTPSIWSGQVAFGRIERGHGLISQVMLYSPRSRHRRLRKLTHGVVPVCHLSHERCFANPPEGQLESLSLDGGMATFLWGVRPADDLRFGEEVRADNLLNGHSTLVASTESAEACTHSGLEGVTLEPPIALGPRTLSSDWERFDCYGRNASRLTVRRAGTRRGSEGELSANVLALASEANTLYGLVPPQDGVPGAKDQHCAPLTPCAIEPLPRPPLTQQHALPRVPFPG